MSPQPYLTKGTRLNPEFMPQALSLRPSLAARIGEVIAHWSWIEAEYVAMTAAVLEADHHIVCEMIDGIVSTEARRGAIMGAISAGLEERPDDLLCARAIDRAINPVRSARIKIAHGLWGVDEGLPDSLLWMHQRDMAREDFANRKPDGKFLDHDPKKIMVYDLPELDRMVSDAYTAWDWVQYLSVLILIEDEEIRRHLLSEPAISSQAQKLSQQTPQ